jgi:predicted NBD/HSP70 family sugar kinase
MVSWYTRVEQESGEPSPYEEIDGWDDYEVKGLVRDALAKAGFPRIEPDVLNDADCEALGEATVGVGRQERPLIVVKVTGGIGAGCVLEGPRVFRGRDGFAGELGHVPVVAVPESKGLEPLSLDKLCTCNESGHVQCYSSMQAIVDRLGVEGSDLPARAKALKRRWKSRAVRQAFFESGQILGAALSAAVAILDAEMVVVRTRDYMAHTRLLEGVKEPLERLPNPPKVEWGVDSEHFAVCAAAVYAIQNRVLPRLTMAAEERGAAPPLHDADGKLVEGPIKPVSPLAPRKR